MAERHVWIPMADGVRLAGDYGYAVAASTFAGPGPRRGPPPTSTRRRSRRTSAG
jgi:predicted acyl esterase